MDPQRCARLVEEAERHDWFLPAVKELERSEWRDLVVTAMREGLTESPRALWALLMATPSPEHLEVLFGFLGRPAVKEAMREHADRGVFGWSRTLYSLLDEAVRNDEAVGHPGWDWTDPPTDSPLLRAFARHRDELDEAVVDLLQLLCFQHGGPVPPARALRRKACEVLASLGPVPRPGSDRVTELPPETWREAVREALRLPELYLVCWHQLDPHLEHLDAVEAVGGWRWVASPRAFAYLVELAERYGEALLAPLPEARAALRRRLRRLDEEQIRWSWEWSRSEDGPDPVESYARSLHAVDAVEAMLRARKGQPAPPEADASLRALLADEEPSVLEPMRTVLRALPEDRREELLRSALEERPAPTLALCAADTLAPEAARKLLEPALRHAAVSWWTVPLARTLAAAAADDPSWLRRLAGRVRDAGTLRAIVEAMRRLATGEALDGLVELTGARNASVRSAARRALAELGEAGREAARRGAASGPKAVQKSCGELLAALSAWPGPTPLQRLRAEAERADLSDVREALRRWSLVDEPDSIEEEPLVELVRRRGPVALVPLFDWVLEMPDPDRHRLGLWCTLVQGMAPLDPELLIWPDKWQPEERPWERWASEVAWIGVELMARLPWVGSMWADLIRFALRSYKERRLEPVLYALSVAEPALREPFYADVAEYGPERGRELLLRGLSDGAKSVREACIEGLVRIGPQVAPELLERLTASKKSTRIAAAQALVRIARPEHLPALREALRAARDPALARLLEEAVEAAGGTADELVPQEVVARLERIEASPLPSWLQPETLPPLRTADGRELPPRAVLGLLALMRNERPSRPEAELRRVRPMLDAAQAEAFAQAVYRAWHRAGKPPADKWALFQLAALGGPRCFEEEAPLLDELAGAGEHAFARWFLRTMARHGSPRAHAWVAHWARAARRFSVQEEAEELLGELAREAGLGVRDFASRLDRFVADEAEERRTPTFGMEGGARLFDLGSRRVELRLVAGGSVAYWDVGRRRRLARLPAARPGEDQEARSALIDTRKKVAAALRKLAGLLERAMLNGRRWEVDRFVELFREHPLFASMGEALVFRAGEGPSFRLSDGTPLSADFDQVALPREGEVRLLHRLDMDEEAAVAWSEHLADAELQQPFPQVGRPVFDARRHPLTEPLGSVPRVMLAGRLRRLGWSPAPGEDEAKVTLSARPFPGRGIQAFLAHEGYFVDDPLWKAEEPVEVLSVGFYDEAGQLVPPERVDPVVFSEVRYDLERLLASS